MQLGFGKNGVFFNSAAKVGGQTIAKLTKSQAALILFVAFINFA